MSENKPKLKTPATAAGIVKSNKTKLALAVVGVLGGTIIISQVFFGPGKYVPPPQKENVISTTPGTDNLYRQDVANHVASLSDQNQKLQQQVQALSKQLAYLSKKQTQTADQMNQKIGKLSQEQQAAKIAPTHSGASAQAGTDNGATGTAALKGQSFKAPPAPIGGYVPPPPPVNGYTGAGTSAGAVSAAAAPSNEPVVVVNAAAAAPKKKGLSVTWQKNPYAGFIPAGSFAEAAMLTGLDAGTADYTRSNPEPVLMRVQSNAQLPGAQKYGIKACFVMGSGYGDLSSERVYIRLTRLSCVSPSRHAIVSSAISGYVVDSDGVLGMRGRVINRTGALLAKALMAGFAQGAAQIAQTATQTLTTSSLTGSTTATLEPNKILKSGAFGGIGNAASILAKQYIAEAKNIYPVIEVPPGRKASIVITKGMSLKWHSYEGLYTAVPAQPQAGTVKDVQAGQGNGTTNATAASAAFSAPAAPAPQQ